MEPESPFWRPDEDTCYRSLKPGAARSSRRRRRRRPQRPLRTTDSVQRPARCPVQLCRRMAAMHKPRVPMQTQREGRVSCSADDSWMCLAMESLDNGVDVHLLSHGNASHRRPACRQGRIGSKSTTEPIPIKSCHYRILRCAASLDRCGRLPHDGSHFKVFSPALV